MTRKLFALLLGFTASAMIIVACTHKNNDVQPVGNGPGNDTTNNGGNPSEPDTALCFERDILPIFVSNCGKSGCHDAATRQDGYEFTSYQTITAKKFVAGNANKTELYKKIIEHDPNDIMPPPPNAPLTALQTSRIYDWIQRGAPNTTGCTIGCDSVSFKFATTIQPMLSQYCRGCHNSATASSGVNLDSYAGVKTVADNGKLLPVIRQEPGVPAMPQNGKKLSDCQIKQVEKWIGAGALNN